jgi:hypothetical protein
MFVYVDCPSTECVRLYLNDPEHVAISAYKLRNDTVMLLFVADPDKVLLVGILYMISESDWTHSRSYAIGSARITHDQGSNLLKMKWVELVPGGSLSEHLAHEKSGTQYAIEFEIAIQSVGDPSRTCRLTALDPMFPSPLLTLSDIRLEIAPGLIKKKIPEHDPLVYVAVSLRKSHSDQKSTEGRVLSAFISPAAMEPQDTGFTSPVPVSAEKIAFVEPLHFVIDGSLRETISVQIEVWASRKPGKWKKKLTFTTNLTKAREMHKRPSDAKVKAFARFDTMYSVIFAPPPGLCKSLDDPSEDPPITDLMYPPLVPYIISRRIAIDQLGQTDFRRLFALFIGADLSLQVWIEHYFTPDPGFADLFLQKVVDNFSVIESLPMPFFMLIFKAMRVDNHFNGSALSRLFSAVARAEGAKPPPEARSSRESSYNAKTQNVSASLKSAADLLVQLGQSCPANFVHHLARRFLAQLGLVHQFFVFNYLLSDYTVIQSLLIFSFNSADCSISLFKPLLSLLYATLNRTFMDNKPDMLWKASRTLSLLAVTLEQYTYADNVKQMAQTLFPLLPVIVTFYDSIANVIQNDIYILTPILLFMFKNAHPKQFLQYYSMLSSDNQLRFFDFLIAFASPQIIRSVSKATVSLSVLNTSHEIIWRLTVFLSFMLNCVSPDEKIIQQLFRVHTFLLGLPHAGTEAEGGPIQATESIELILHSMNRLFLQHIRHIFIQETGLLSHIVIIVVAIANQKRQIARSQSIGFLLYILAHERALRASMTPCDLTIQDAVCTTYFAMARLFHSGTCFPLNFLACKLFTRSWSMQCPRRACTRTRFGRFCFCAMSSKTSRRCARESTRTSSQ